MGHSWLGVAERWRQLKGRPAVPGTETGRARKVRAAPLGTAGARRGGRRSRAGGGAVRGAERGSGLGAA